MEIKLAELHLCKGEPLPFRAILEPEALKHRHREIRGMTPVQAAGTAEQAGNLYHVKGEMESDVQMVCSRCLQPFTCHLVVPFKETYAPAGTEIAEDDSDVLVLASDEIELDPMLEEHFLLAVPSFPLCAEDCRGLCPTCGVNRNEQPCSCKNERIDPRLAALADFFDKQDD